MGIVLKVTPEVLIKMANDIEKQIGDVRTQFSEIEVGIGRTRSFWEGEASDSHMEQYSSLKENINEIINNLKNHPINLLQMAGLYTRTEMAVTSAAQSLREDVIV